MFWIIVFQLLKPFPEWKETRAEESLVKNYEKGGKLMEDEC